MLRVQKKMCVTCVYRPGSPICAADLEEAVRDRFGGFDKHRICHSSHDAVCGGFWRRHKDKFALGQIAQRLNVVQFVQDNIPTKISKQVKLAWEALRAQKDR